MMNAIFICKVIILTLGSICFFGCSGDEKNIPRNLINYRILAVVAEPPQVMLSDIIAGNSPTVRVRAVDFEPNDLEGPKEREYEWTLCFSVGAVTQFACLDDFSDVPRNALADAGFLYQGPGSHEPGYRFIQCFYGPRRGVKGPGLKGIPTR